MRTAQELNSLAFRTRKMWNEDGYSPLDIFAIVNGWKEKEDVVICINSRTSYGRQRFTLAHELYHVLYDEDMKRVICNMSMNDDKPQSEREAD